MADAANGHTNVGVSVLQKRRLGQTDIEGVEPKTVAPCIH